MVGDVAAYLYCSCVSCCEKNKDNRHRYLSC